LSGRTQAAAGAHVAQAARSAVSSCCPGARRGPPRAGYARARHRYRHGLAAEVAAQAVGPSDHVVATDISPAVIERARERLAGVPNVFFAVEDGERLTLLAGSFDAVLCNIGLMSFPDPARGLAEFHRTLRPGGRVAASVTPVPSAC
jgi:SAM-dependent methyltransferase